MAHKAADGAQIGVPADVTLPGIEAALVVGAVAASFVMLVRIAGRLRRGLPVIEPRPHPPATWGGADVAVVVLVYLAMLGVAGAAVGAEAPLRRQLAADIVTKVATTLVGSAVLRSAGASWSALGVVGGRWRDDVRIAVGGMAFVLAPLLAVAAILNRIVPYRHPIVTFLQEQRDPVALSLVVVAAVVVAPVAEEFFFRRVLQGWLERRLPEADGAAAIGLSAAAFAAAHLGHGLAAAPLFLFGIVLGAIARNTGSLVPCTLLHALFNAASVALLVLTPPAAGGG